MSLKPKSVLIFTDYLIIASFLLLPHTFFGSLETSLFSNFKLQQVLVFSVPIILITMRIVYGRSTFHLPVIRMNIKYFLFIAYGLFMAGFYSSEFSYESLKFYIIDLYWMTLVLLFLSISNKNPVYYINLVRLFFVHIAILGLVFYLLYGVLGFRNVFFTIHPQTLTGSYDFVSGLSIHHSNSPWFSNLVPRYTFYFQEPRIIGARLPLALFLQIGFIKNFKAEKRKMGIWPWVGLFALILSMFIIHSIWGYVSLLLSLVFLCMTEISKANGLMYKTIFYVLLLSIIGFSTIITYNKISKGTEKQVVNPIVLKTLGNKMTLEHQHKISSDMNHFSEFILNLYEFPLGSGLIPKKREFYLEKFDIDVGGGIGYIHYLVIHAGIFGILFLVYIISRCVKMLKLTKRYGDVYLSYFAIMVLYCILSSLVGNWLYFSPTLFLFLFLTELSVFRIERT